MNSSLRFSFAICDSCSDSLNRELIFRLDKSMQIPSVIKVVFRGDNGEIFVQTFFPREKDGEDVR